MSLLPLALAALLAANGPPASAVDDALGPAAMQRLAHSLRTSASARERALGATLYVEDDADTQTTRGRILREAAEAVPSDILVQSLWANADAAESGCTTTADCPQRRLALSRLEPDNGLAWLPALADMDPVGDGARFDGLMEKLAAADRFDDHYVEFLQAWMDALSKRAPSRESARDQAVAYFAGTVGNWHYLSSACRRKDWPSQPAHRFELCAEIGRRVVRTAPSMIARTYGLSLLGASGMANPEDLEARRVYFWRQQAASSGPHTPAESARWFEDILSTGSELRALDLRVVRNGFPLQPPADWKESDFRIQVR